MRVIGAVAIIIILGGLGYFFYQDSAKSNNDQNGPTAEVSLTEEYVSEKYSFKFKHPKSYRVSFVEDLQGKDILTVIGSNPREGFQVEIQPIDEDLTTLTSERIKQDLPDIKIESPQDVIIGAAGKGTAFLSDDPTFDGRSREVWFVFKQNLYQIRTYASNDQFLQSVLSTWEFQ
jgi:hypothetical protein